MAPKDKQTSLPEHEDGDEWIEDGITYRQVFGEAKAISIGDDWEDVVLDEGELIDFDTYGRVFVGTYLGNKVVPDLEGINGEKRDVTLILLEDSNGTRYSTWAGYVLENAIKPFVPGDGIMIEPKGKKSFGKNGQTMAAFNVRRKPVHNTTANA